LGIILILFPFYHICVELHMMYDFMVKSVILVEK